MATVRQIHSGKKKCWKHIWNIIFCFYLLRIVLWTECKDFIRKMRTLNTRRSQGFSTARLPMKRMGTCIHGQPELDTARFRRGNETTNWQNALFFIEKCRLWTLGVSAKETKRKVLQITTASDWPLGDLPDLRISDGKDTDSRHGAFKFSKGDEGKALAYDWSQAECKDFLRKRIDSRQRVPRTWGIGTVEIDPLMKSETSIPTKKQGVEPRVFPPRKWSAMFCTQQRLKIDPATSPKE